MSRLIQFKPISRPDPQAKFTEIIRNQSLFDDFVQLANLYQMAFPDFQDEVIINSYDSAADAAKTFFCMIEDEYFPLEHMWEWDDIYENYEGTIRRWLTEIPVKVVGYESGFSLVNMTEAKALLVRLQRIGNYSDTANEHKQVLRCQYPKWEWGNLLDTFQLIGAIKELDNMFLPAPFDQLPALVKYMTHETDTYFLDYSLSEWPHHIMWNEFNLDWLKDDWKVALKIMNRSEALCDWLDQNPEQLEKVWKCLVAAHKRRGV